MSMYSIMDHMENNNTYNGWYNRATWNLYLWIGNDESAYNHFRDLYHRIGEDDEDDRTDMIEREAREWFGSTTPDGDALSDVFWEEVREHMDDDNSDIIEDLRADSAEYA